MSRKGLFTETTRSVSSAPRSEPCIAPTLGPACCVCGLLQDKMLATPYLERWVTPRAYCEAYGVNPAKLKFLAKNRAFLLSNHIVH